MAETSRVSSGSRQVVESISPSRQEYRRIDESTSSSRREFHCVVVESTRVVRQVVESIVE